MALGYPLSTAQFMAALPIREITFDIPEAVEMNETGGGEVLTAELGTRLWSGEVFLADMEPDESPDVLARLDLLRRPGASFMAYDVARPYPRADFGGKWLLTSAAVPKLHSVDGNARELRLSGLPPWYRLQPLDYIAFSYGSAPVRSALHRVVVGGMADVSGVTPLIEVSPSLRPGWAANADVQLIKAACKAVIVPGSVQIGRRSASLIKGATFKFMQTLR